MSKYIYLLHAAAAALGLAAVYALTVGAMSICGVL